MGHAGERQKPFLHVKMTGCQNSFGHADGQGGRGGLARSAKAGRDEAREAIFAYHQSLLQNI